MAKPGPKKDYKKSAFDLCCGMRKYINRQKEAGEFFPEEGMYLFVDCTEAEVREMSEKDTKDGLYLRHFLEMAKLERAEWLNINGHANIKAAKFAEFQLKQQKNGGYIDKPMEKGDRTLTINLLGVGGEAAFK